MPVLDFTEIPEAHLATGRQDTFELFARDFLILLDTRSLRTQTGELTAVAISRSLRSEPELAARPQSGG